MRWFLAVVLLMGVMMTLHAETYVYVSTGPDQKIQVFRLDSTDGKLTAVSSTSTDGTPGAIVVDPKKKFLFVSLRSTSKLASYGIDPATKKLTLISSVSLPKGENAAHINTDRTGRWLLSASYSAGKIVVHRIGDDGKIQFPPVQTIETAKTAHCVGIDAENRWAFVPHVAPNAVYQYRFDAATGRLADSGKAAGGTDKAGPRHIALHPTQKLAFTSNEVGNSITAYRFDAETGLKPVQTLSTLPADFTGKNTNAEVKVHPSGKFVWVSNRGHESLAGFAIDAKTGNLSPLGQTPTEQTPRSFDFSPDGRFMFAAGEGTGKLAVFTVDLDNGNLTRTNTYEIAKSLTWVQAVDFPNP